jgi:hypothetical protein
MYDYANIKTSSRISCIPILGAGIFAKPLAIEAPFLMLNYGLGK